MQVPFAMCLAMLAMPLPVATAQTSDAGAAGERARSWIEEALDAMGGEATLRAIERVRFESLGHRHMLEQSERPERPWLVAYESTIEARDHQRGAVWQQREERSIASPQPMKMIRTAAEGVAQIDLGGQKRADGVAQVEEAEEWLALSPERVLLLAYDARDVRAEDDLTYHEVPHHVVSFAWQPGPRSAPVPVKVLLNAWTKLPSAVEWTRAMPHDLFWCVWGDVPQRMVYTLWSLQANGLRYPLQWDLERDGKPFLMRTLFKLELNPELPADLFAISADVKKQFAQREAFSRTGPPLGRPTPLVPSNEDLVQFVGAWNCALIRQPDGVVILESPIGGAFSEAVMKEAGRRFPGAPIKAVITTSDAYPHMAGVREYVAAGGADLRRGPLARKPDQGRRGAARSSSRHAGAISQAGAVHVGVREDRRRHGNERARPLSHPQRERRAHDDGLSPRPPAALRERPRAAHARRILLLPRVSARGERRGRERRPGRAACVRHALGGDSLERRDRRHPASGGAEQRRLGEVAHRSGVITTESPRASTRTGSAPLRPTCAMRTPARKSIATVRPIRFFEEARPWPVVSPPRNSREATSAR
jgi:hypothetical protein